MNFTAINMHWQLLLLTGSPSGSTLVQTKNNSPPVGKKTDGELLSRGTTLAREQTWSQLCTQGKVLPMCFLLRVSSDLGGDGLKATSGPFKTPQGDKKEVTTQQTIGLPCSRF